MRIQVLKSCAGLDFAYYESETVDCDDAVAKDLIYSRYSKYVKPTKTNAGAKTKSDALLFK